MNTAQEEEEEAVLWWRHKSISVTCDGQEVSEGLFDLPGSVFTLHRHSKATGKVREHPDDPLTSKKGFKEVN